MVQYVYKISCSVLERRMAQFQSWSNEQVKAGRASGWAGLIVVAVACGGALVQGLAHGWSAGYALGYALIALLFIALSQAFRFSPTQRLLEPLWIFLLVIGLVYLALQIVSGDPFLQPMAIGVPVVYAALYYNLHRTLAVAALFIGLLALGLVLGGQFYAQAIILPVIGYGTMTFSLIAFTRQAVEQGLARARADSLAADLARQRDELAWLVAENSRLQGEVRLSATLAERNRLARELHDTIAQGLTAVTMQLDAASRSFERDPARSRTRLNRAHELSRQALEDVRRSVWTLAEPLVDGTQLTQALARLTERFQRRTGLHACYAHHGAALALDHAAASQVLRIVQEALQNVEKHAHARTVTVGSESLEDTVRFWVSDDGVGFDPAMQPMSSGGNGGSFGLVSLHERARLAGGTLLVESAPGAGTRVLLEIRREAGE